MARASSDWSRSTVLDAPVVAGQAKGKCRPTAGRVEVCNGSYGFNGWLGIAQIWLRGSHIRQDTARMNDSYLGSGHSTTNKQHVICQEVGHSFGLDHQDESGADLDRCMDYAKNLDNPSPNQHDYDQLVSIYSHLDSTRRWVQTSPVGAAGSANASPIAVQRSDRIVSSTITERFADGTSRVMHILWAVGGKAAPNARAHPDKGEVRVVCRPHLLSTGSVRGRMTVPRKGGRTCVRRSCCSSPPPQR